MLREKQARDCEIIYSRNGSPARAACKTQYTEWLNIRPWKSWLKRCDHEAAISELIFGANRDKRWACKHGSESFYCKRFILKDLLSLF